MSEQIPETAGEAYERTYADICRLAAKILNRLATDHDNKREKTWADVGTQEYVGQQLWEIDTFLSNH